MELFGFDIGVGQIIGGVIGSIVVGILGRLYYKARAKIREQKAKLSKKD